jgi:hypothetical protein
MQDRTNLKSEWSVDGADTPQRFVFGWSYELPVGRGKPLGRNMNRVLNTIVGGWQTNGYLTFQSGNPIPIYMYASRLADGTQRPNLNGNPRSNLSIQDVVDGKGSYFNASAFSDPGDQKPGNSPRYNPDLREDGLNNLDLSVFKNFKFTERMKLQLRAEFFNFTNTPTFKFDKGIFNIYGAANTSFGSPNFGIIDSTRNDPRQFQFGIRFLF